MKAILITFFMLSVVLQATLWAGGQKEKKPVEKPAPPPGILDMAQSSDSASIEKLLNVNIDLNEKDELGQTALHIVSQKGDQAIAGLLLASGADANAQDNEGRTPLQLALGNGNTEIMRRLIESGADITLADVDGQSPASIIVTRPVNQLLSIVNKDNVNAQLSNDSYLLHMVAKEGQHENLKALIEIGADTRLLNSEGKLAVDMSFQSPVTVDKLIGASLLIGNASPLPANPVWHYASKVFRTGNYSQRLEYGITAFHLAAESNHESMLRFLLTRGVDVNIRDQSGNTALHIAARLGYISMAHFLLQNGALINARDYTQNAPIHESVTAGDSFTMMSTLLAKDADPNVKNSSGSTPFHLVVALPESQEAFKLLLSNNADITVRDRSGNTPLHTAVKSANKSASQFLTENGADIFAQDNTGKSPVDIALTSTPEVVDWFFYDDRIARRIDNTGRGTLHMAVSLGADMENLLVLFGKNVDPNLRDYNGDSPLHYAAARKDTETFTVLLENGSNMFIENNEGQTPLSIAFTGGVAYTNAVLQGRIETMDSEENTPLFHATLWGYDRIAKALIDNGANIAHVNLEGQTALHLAVYVRSISMASILLKAGLNPNTGDITGKTPLHDAAIWGVPGIITLLALNGADVNQTDLLGQTSLHRASFSGENASVIELLKVNAKINFFDNNGQTPLFIAAQADRDEIIHILTVNNADTTIRDNQGRTALHIAVLNQAEGSVRKLVEVGSDIFATDARGSTPIDMVITNNPLLIRVMVDSKSVNRQDNMGNTPLHIAVTNNASEDVIRLLLSMGARKTIRNAQGKNPEEIAQSLNNTLLSGILAE